MKKVSRELTTQEKKWLYRAFKDPIIRYGNEQEETVEKPNTYFLDQIPYLKVKAECECGCATVYFYVQLNENSYTGAILDMYDEKKDLHISIFADVVTGKLTGIEAV